LQAEQAADLQTVGQMAEAAPAAIELLLDNQSVEVYLSELVVAVALTATVVARQLIHQELLHLHQLAAVGETNRAAAEAAAMKAVKAAVVVQAAKVSTEAKLALVMVVVVVAVQAALATPVLTLIQAAKADLDLQALSQEVL
jgi:hypothetical protein